MGAQLYSGFGVLESFQTHDNGKPVERRGRKVTGLRGANPTMAGLPNVPTPCVWAPPSCPDRLSEPLTRPLNRFAPLSIWGARSVFCYLRHVHRGHSSHG